MGRIERSRRPMLNGASTDQYSSDALYGPLVDAPYGSENPDASPWMTTLRMPASAESNRAVSDSRAPSTVWLGNSGICSNRRPCM
eukprot:CAMPEP_0185708352 /NCGR_PEP_ID=MMETSP1164-20130828/26382_1 /TAXON_ID=1104430 /ORGANISM="Chrysoreinhardia sp, Strain CCMP2950" /LENGTH=84 /DNA_ID=CAMNT_0028375807 /DNA_START=64 /DNA_END=315 /DNA_ORIENTATION=+